MAARARLARRRSLNNASSPRTCCTICPGPFVSVYRTRSEDETIELGRHIAVALPRRAVVLLIGNLGAGKTTLAKGIISGLRAAEPEEGSSPTFTLIHEYGRVY